MSERPLPQTSVKQKRELTIERLCEHFARDRLELQDFESRLDRAHRATTLPELDELLRDLPAPSAAPTPEQQTRDAIARSARAVTEAIRESRTLLAIMGGVERRGRWDPARRNVVIAIMGGAVLDFRQVPLPPGQTEVSVFCMMGGVEIIVPPGMSVDASGFAIMGGFEHAAARRDPDPDAPTLRITGFSMMGGVEIQVRNPGESAREARKRERDERRLAREERRLEQERRRLRGEP